MTLPASLAQGLAEHWPLTEGEGTVARGALGRLDLALAGGARGPSLDSNWNRPDQNPCCAAEFVATLPEPWDVLGAVGSVCTIAVEWWYSGYGTTVGPVHPAPPAGYGTSVTLLRLDQSDFDAAVAVYLFPQPPPPQDPSTNTHVYFGTVPAGNGSATFAEAPPVVAYDACDPVVVLLDCERVSPTTVRCRLYVGGALWPSASPGFYDQVLSSGFDLSVLRFGDDGAVNPGVFRGMAVWLRRLTTPEREALAGEGLGGLGAPVDAEPPTLVDVAGNPAIHPRFGAGRHGLGSAVQDRRALVHTRAVCETRGLRRSLSCELHSGAELDLVRRAWTGSRGGAGTALYRHPREDAAATPHRLPATLTVTRTAGGQAAGFDLELTKE